MLPLQHLMRPCHTLRHGNDLGQPCAHRCGSKHWRKSLSVALESLAHAKEMTCTATTTPTAAPRSKIQRQRTPTCTNSFATNNNTVYKPKLSKFYNWPHDLRRRAALSPMSRRTRRDKVLVPAALTPASGLRRDNITHAPSEQNTNARHRVPLTARQRLSERPKLQASDLTARPPPRRRSPRVADS
jgi:hypothetical protein